VSQRRLVQLFVLAALALAPFGRLGMAQAMTMHDAPMTMTGHCTDQPMPDRDKHHRMAVDCMIACAAIASAATFQFVPPSDTEAVLPAISRFRLAGIRPGSDPPPPRRS